MRHPTTWYWNPSPIKGFFLHEKENRRAPKCSIGKFIHRIQNKEAGDNRHKKQKENT